MTAREALVAAARQLEAVSDTPRLDAELLMADALGVARDALILSHLDAAVPSDFEALLKRRLGHEPMAYILGWRDFWTIRLGVGPGVLIPRPDSETLIEAALGHFQNEPPRRILDLGTGPGTLLLAALSEWPEAYGLGIDASERALHYAEMNAADLGLEDRARFQLGDWAHGLEGQFDLILCNPPYVESDALLASELGFEPDAALFAGPDGLDAYRKIIPALPALMAPGGMIALEIGHQQATAVQALMAENGMASEARVDLGGRNRVIVHFALGKRKAGG